MVVHSILSTVKVQHLDNYIAPEKQQKLSITDIAQVVEKNLDAVDFQKVMGDKFISKAGGSSVVIFVRKQKLSKQPPKHILCTESSNYYVIHSNVFNSWIKEEQQPKKVFSQNKNIAGMFTSWQPA